MPSVEVGGEELDELVEGDQVALVVQVDVAGTGDNVDLLRLSGGGVRVVGEVAGVAVSPVTKRIGRGEI
ncbi:hypothetical protein [Curtobacterium flaccumfaciens]|uniref:hypothetical protein n=1 Tax=Curtobacterium flaccumfaciens TaxID=2035 RepID=UPI00159EECDD|nr:hypothetical protein [Curtobacterium flaccumfaciens]